MWIICKSRATVIYVKKQKLGKHLAANKMSGNNDDQKVNMLLLKMEKEAEKSEN